MAFRGLYEHSLDSKDRLTVPSRFRASLSDGIVLSKGFDPCVWVHTTPEFEQLSDRFLSPHSPFGSDARQLRRRFHGGSFDEKLDAAGRIRVPKPLIEHAGLDGNCVVIGAGEYLEIWNADAWAKQEQELDAAAPEIAEGLAAAARRVIMRLHAEPISISCGREFRPGSIEPMTHQPVLAPELTSLLAPEPGQTAVDCTFGAGGHARQIAAQLGPSGTLVAIDRDPAAAGRFAEFAAAAPCRTRFIGADFAEGLRALHGEGVRPEMVYVDLGMSSMQVDAWERGFSYSYDAPLDMRMDTRQSFSAADLVNEWPEARIAQVLRRFGEERYAGGIAREIVRRRPLNTTAELVAAIKAGMPAAARFGGGHPAKRSFQAIRIAVNGELDSLEGALPLAWEMLAVGGRSPRSPSTRSRTGR